MKTRAGCAVLAVMATVISLTGCQNTVAKTKKPPEVTEQAKVQTRTVCTRDPKTGEIIRKQVPVNVPGQEQPKTRTVRTRDPRTGRTITKEVPISTTSPKPATPGEFELSWTEKCTVQQAFNSVQEFLYRTLGLSKVTAGGGYYLSSDSISAAVKARSANEVIFSVYVVFDTPETSIIILKANSKTQRNDILRKQTLFIRSKISEAIAKGEETVEVKVDAPPYPKTMIVDRSISQVSTAITEWNNQAELEGRNYGGDKYYRQKSSRSASGIEFTFTMRMIDVDKTKLIINVRSYERKDEFNVIVKSLEEALAELEKPTEAAETAASIQTKPGAMQKALTPAEQKASLERKISGIQEVMSNNRNVDPEQKKKENEAWRKLLEALEGEKKAIEAKEKTSESSEEKPAEAKSESSAVRKSCQG